MTAVRAAILALVASGIGGLLVPASAWSAGERYDVVQCHYLHRGIPDARITDAAAYVVRPRCANAEDEHAIKIENVGRAAAGQAGRIRWKAPPGTGIVAVRVNAKLRRDGDHRARLYMADDQLRETIRVGYGRATATPWEIHTWNGTPQNQFVATLFCQGPTACRASDVAKAWIKSVRLTLADFEDPEVEVEGDLFAADWIRGEVGARTIGNDVGSGVSRISVAANDQTVDAMSGDCDGALDGSGFAARLAPCDSAGALVSALSTTQAPWINGRNDVRGCIADFAGNTQCQSPVVWIDNAVPQLAFADVQLPDDPELIRVAASDEHSGISSGSIFLRAVGASTWEPLTTQRTTGELRARVDSTAKPPGDYEFMVEAQDAAGNSSATTLRQDGTPMRLQFPLKSGVDLNAYLKPGGSTVQRLEYGESSRVAGRLTNPDGDGLAGHDIVVDEYFGEGALIDHRIRTVTTDENGRWSSRLPAGPSRSVTARFAGDQRYLGGTAYGGRLAVRTGARFAASRERVREGRSVVFTGKVRRLGARIPPRGKLIQLQYHDPTSRRWFTVRNAFYTDSRGRYRLGYRFGRHYEVDVRIRFRLRVLPEQVWPYRGTRTRTRRVTVLAR